MRLTQKNGAKPSNLMYRKKKEKEIDGTIGHKKNLRSSAR